jgi:transcriptional regulator with XRE-family HTH domain
MQFYNHQDIQYKIADKIKAIRKQKKLTQKQMATKSDIPLSTYARIEQLGEGSLKDFAKILIALDRADEINKILQIVELTPVEVYEKQKANL